MNELDKLLNYDPLEQAEKITGKSYKENKGTSLLGMGLLMDNSAAKKRALDAAGDTHFGSKLVDYIKVIEGIGFREVYKEAVIPRASHHTPGDFYYIFWNAERGILLCFDSYGSNETVNGGKFYYNWLPNLDEKGDRVRTAYITSSGGYKKRPGNPDSLVWVGDHDCREAVKHHIQKLEANGTFLPVWEHRPFLWLLNYGETPSFYGEFKYDHNAINESKIAKLPEDVRNAITPKVGA